MLSVLVASDRGSSCVLRPAGSVASFERISIKPGRKHFFLTLVLSIMMVPSAVGAQVSTDASTQKQGAAVQAAGPDTAAQPQAISSLPSEPVKTTDTESSRLQAMQKQVGLKGWDIPLPPFDDTLTRDAGGVRSALARNGIGFVGWLLGNGAVNVLDRPRSSGGEQSYWGQKASAQNSAVVLLSYDLGRIGINGGQINTGAVFSRSSYQPYTANAAALYRLAYYQSLWNGKVEFSAGMMTNVTSFVGTLIGGQLQNPFGSNAAVPSEVGLSASNVAQPTAWIKVHPSEHIYNQFSVARSMSPQGLLENLRLDPSNTRFNIPGGRAMYLDEIGYQKAPAPGDHSTWFRAGIIHNSSRYPVFGTNRTAENDGYYVLMDRQITQPDRSKEGAYKGIYIGASAMYASPKTNIFSQYYEGRIYGEGLIPSRPRDLISFVVTHQKVSGPLADTYNVTSNETGVFAAHSNNTMTGSYTAAVAKGAYLTLGLQYIDKPSVAYRAQDGDALNLLVGTFFVF